MTYPNQPPHQASQPGYRPLPQPMSPGGQPLADFPTRLLAYMIDYALATAVAMVIFVPLILIFTFQQMESFDPATADDAAFYSEFLGPLLLLELGLVVLLLVAYYVYYVEYMHRSGQTVGKRAMKIRVVPLDPGARLTRGMAAKRYVVEFLCGTFVPFFHFVDGFWQLRDKPYQQALHDKWAKTVVVKVGP